MKGDARPIDDKIVCQKCDRSDRPMTSVTISPKFQVVIPKEVRENLDLRPGQKVRVLAYGSRIELIAERPIEEMMGFLPGLDTEVEREEDRL